eukprot:TRINITY_DN8463_c0_g3_i1.p2 TRINITY_DN8463_c0_g3~~TRINITY_DN8463_c0_g3_i1.p2  ORF type:complete len:125 (-),score=6.30 TRINITY_DN8463_c0_g3_i1:23-397(-)
MQLSPAMSSVPLGLGHDHAVVLVLGAVALLCMQRAACRVVRTCRHASSTCTEVQLTQTSSTIGMRLLLVDALVAEHSHHAMAFIASIDRRGWPVHALQSSGWTVPAAYLCSRIAITCLKVEAFG